jgi:hypothetical protein
MWQQYRLTNCEEDVTFAARSQHVVHVMFHRPAGHLTCEETEREYDRSQKLQHTTAPKRDHSANQQQLSVQIDHFPVVKSGLVCVNQEAERVPELNILHHARGLFMGAEQVLFSLQNLLDAGLFGTPCLEHK